jgi:hypothetical protein
MIQVVFRVGIALLKSEENALLLLGFEPLVEALKQLPAYTRPPGDLIKVRMVGVSWLAAISYWCTSDP